MKSFVLIVDDSLTVRMELRKHFAAANFAVTACGTVATARQLLKSQSYDLAVLDQFLPDGSGADLMAELRSDPELCHTPVILLSSTVDAPPEVRSASQPAGFVGKPYDPARLVTLAQSLCKSSTGGKRFLLVDDSPTFLEGLAGQLRQDGNTVLIAMTGEDALAILQREPVDCVIIDMIMPGIGGIETCKRLRTMDKRSDLPVVMLTASENTSGRSQGMAIGADQFLLKSHRFDLLCAQIRGLLRKKQRETRSGSEPPVSDAPPKVVLTEQILASLGLSKSMAKMVLTRACRSLELEPAAVTAADLGRLLPKLCDHLKTFLSPEQLAVRVAALQALAQPGPLTPQSSDLGSSAV